MNNNQVARCSTSSKHTHTHTHTHTHIGVAVAVVVVVVVVAAVLLLFTCIDVTWEVCTAHIWCTHSTQTVKGSPVGSEFCIVKLVSNGYHGTSIVLFPGLPRFVLWFAFSIIHGCVRAAEKRGRPGNEAMKFIERVFAIIMLGALTLYM